MSQGHRHFVLSLIPCLCLKQQQKYGLKWKQWKWKQCCTYIGWICNNARRNNGRLSAVAPDNCLHFTSYQLLRIYISIDSKEKLIQFLYRTHYLPRESTLKSYGGQNSPRVCVLLESSKKQASHINLSGIFSMPFSLAFPQYTHSP